MHLLSCASQLKINMLQKGIKYISDGGHRGLTQSNRCPVRLRCEAGRGAQPWPRHSDLLTLGVEAAAVVVVEAIAVVDVGPRPQAVAVVVDAL